MMKLKLHTKITFATLAVVLLILTGIFLFLQKNLATHTFGRIRTSLYKEASFARVFLESKVTPLMTLESFDAIADEIGMYLDVRTTIIAEDGVVLGDSQLSIDEVRQVETHSDRPEIKQALTDGSGESRRFSVTIKKDLLYVVKPFRNDETVGLIRLSLPLSEIEFLQSRMRGGLLVAVAVAFLGAIIFSLISSSGISHFSLG